MSDQGAMMPAMCKALPLLDLLAARPIWVDDLGDAIAVDGTPFILVDSALDPTGLARVAEQALSLDLSLADAWILAD